MTYGHEAQAKAELSHAQVTSVGRLLRELLGWPFASKRMRSLQAIRELRRVGPSHLHAAPRVATSDQPHPRHHERIDDGPQARPHRAPTPRGSA